MDPIIVRKLAHIHPLRVPELLTQSIGILAGVTGIPQEHIAFADMRAVRSIQELAQIHWEELTGMMAVLTRLNSQACESLVEHVSVFADRAIHHHCLFLAKSASTTLLTQTHLLSVQTARLEMAGLNQEIEECVQRADQFLHAGRAHLNAFQHMALQQASYITLHALLQQAGDCYNQYWLAYQQLDDVIHHIGWYLAEREQSGMDKGPQVTSAA